MTWRAAATIIDASNGVDAAGIKGTLKQKGALRFVNLGELAWRTDPESQLGQDARPIVENFTTEGGALEDTP